MLEYADITFYKDDYRCGTSGRLADSDFRYYARKATGEIRARTFGNIVESVLVSDEVKMCCCEVAERLFDFDSARTENGLVLQSYSNDGDSGTFQISDITTEGMAAAVDQIIRRWLLDTGLMFCGRRCHEP